jgi:hypothetical protein
MRMAMKEFSDKELKIIGAILYSCEGTRLRKNKRHKGNTFIGLLSLPIAILSQ